VDARQTPTRCFSGVAPTLIHDYRKQAEDPSEPDFESLDLENL